jgi:hypothetical protein|tara:strand:- start:1598 stop:1927 length:330 start_codon:yes stop_codon:yes gene_type:complete
MKEKLVLNFESWNIKQINRSKDRMKLQIKLSKEEAQAFKNFTEMVKPPEIPDDDFLKGIFKIGVETMEMKLMEAVQQHAQENDIDLDKLAEETESVEETQDEVQDSKTV